MIKADHLQKRFADRTVVRDVSFSVAEGEVVGFLGANGAGKTTTLRMLTTFLSPSAGSARVAGFDVLTQSREVRGCIGYLPESPPLYEELTVEEYLTFAARIKGVPAKKVRGAVSEVIEKCALGEVRRRLCHQLSKGYRQRAGIAQALVHNPKVVILDEPTSGLDPQQVVQIRSLIADFAREHTVVLSTHILSEVVLLCSKAVIIHEGCVVREAPLSALSQERSLEDIFLECVTGERREQPCVL